MSTNILQPGMRVRCIIFDFLPQGLIKKLLPEVVYTVCNINGDFCQLEGIRTSKGELCYIFHGRFIPASGGNFQLPMEGK